jgi:hypothetical protein
MHQLMMSPYGSARMVTRLIPLAIDSSSFSEKSPVTRGTEAVILSASGPYFLAVLMLPPGSKIIAGY